MSDVNVRAAKVADEPAVLTLAHAEMLAHQSVDRRFRLREDALDRYTVYLRERMRDFDSSVFVAESDGKIVGLAIGSIRKQDSFFEVQRYGYVSDLMVDPEARRLGIGRALYDRIALWIRGLGIDTVRLHVASQSEEARAFWRKLGATDFMAEAWIELDKDFEVPRAQGESASEQPDGVAPKSTGRDLTDDGMIDLTESGI